MKSFWINNGYTGTPLPDYGTYSLLTGESRDDFDTAPILSDPSKKYMVTLFGKSSVEIILSGLKY